MSKQTYIVEAEVVTPQYLEIEATSKEEAMKLAEDIDGPDWEIGDEEPREIINATLKDED